MSIDYSRLGSLTVRELNAALLAEGFLLVRQRGSHRRFGHSKTAVRSLLFSGSKRIQQPLNLLHWLSGPIGVRQPSGALLPVAVSIDKAAGGLGGCRSQRLGLGSYKTASVKRDNRPFRASFFAPVFEGLYSRFEDCRSGSIKGPSGFRLCRTVVGSQVD